MTEARQYMERRWIALLLLCFAQFIVVIDASIVNVALPSIGEARLLQENLSGRQRLRADLRRLPAPGRAHGRPAWARVFISGLLLVAVASSRRASPPPRAS